MCRQLTDVKEEDLEIPGGIPGGEKSEVTAVQLETHIGVFEKHQGM